MSPTQAGRATAMDLDQVNEIAITPALLLFPPKLTSPAARVMLLAIGQQESRFIYRCQVGGPARSFWQFEKGGGVHGVMTHPMTTALCRVLCKARSVDFDINAVYAAMEFDDVLGAGMARLLLYSDAAPLPAINDAQGAWDCYVRNWGPGKPRRETWDAFHAAAVAAIVTL